MLRRALLVCGVVSSLVYVGADVLAAIVWPGYHSFRAQAISELMASGAPTERLVDPIFLLYDVLLVAFAAGIWMSDHRRRARIVAGLLFACGAIGLLGPTVGEMDLRSAGVGVSSADARHIALTGLLSGLLIAAVAVGASLRGPWFRIGSYATLLIMIAFGVLTSVTARGIDTGDPTPWAGLTERICIGAALGWVAALAVSMLGVASGHRQATT